MKSTQIEHLKLFSLNAITENTSNVLLVGNAYGIMPYIAPLAHILSQKGFNPYWFAFSGQEGTNGHYSYKECTSDIRIISDWINEKHPNTPFSIISHCAGSLMTLEYLKNNPDNKVKKLIIYGLLYAMDRRRPIAERKLKQCDVKYLLSETDWQYRPLDALSKTNIPLLFCHAKDSLNLDRASIEEMKLSVQSAPNASINWYENGYDDDLNNIDGFIGDYISFLKK